MNAPLCNSLRTHFDDYHDGLLSSPVSGEVRGHLAACEGCKEEYGLLVSCIGVIRGLDAPAVPPRALRRIVDSLSGPESGAPFPDLEGGLETS